MTNPEGLINLLGHASAVNHTAKRISAEETGTGWTWRAVAESSTASAISESNRFLQVLQWVGDKLIVLGTWLKARSGQPRYQHV